MPHKLSALSCVSVVITIEAEAFASLEKIWRLSGGLPDSVPDAGHVVPSD